VLSAFKWRLLDGGTEKGAPEGSKTGAWKVMIGFPTGTRLLGDENETGTEWNDLGMRRDWRQNLDGGAERRLNPSLVDSHYPAFQFPGLTQLTYPRLERILSEILRPSML
jgi:hypothetical protein